MHGNMLTLGHHVQIWFVFWYSIFYFYTLFAESVWKCFCSHQFLQKQMAENQILPVFLLHILMLLYHCHNQVTFSSAWSTMTNICHWWFVRSLILSQQRERTKEEAHCATWFMHLLLCLKLITKARDLKAQQINNKFIWHK